MLSDTFTDTTTAPVRIITFLSETAIITVSCTAHINREVVLPAVATFRALVFGTAFFSVTFVATVGIDAEVVPFADATAVLAFELNITSFSVTFVATVGIGAEVVHSAVATLIHGDASFSSARIAAVRVVTEVTGRVPDCRASFAHGAAYEILTEVVPFATATGETTVDHRAL